MSRRGMRTSLRTCRPISISVWLAARLPSPCPAAPSSGHHTPVVARRGGGGYCSRGSHPTFASCTCLRGAACWCAWPCTASVGLLADSVMPFIRQVPVSACRSTTKRVWPPSSRPCCSTLTYNGQMPQAQRVTGRRPPGGFNRDAAAGYHDTIVGRRHVTCRLLSGEQPYLQSSCIASSYGTATYRSSSLPRAKPPLHYLNRLVLGPLPALIILRRPVPMRVRPFPARAVHVGTAVAP